MMIEDFAVVLSCSDLTTTEAAGLDGVGVLEPVDDIDIVNVLLEYVIPAEPDEVVER